jgi:hypothetical protein
MSNYIEKEELKKEIIKSKESGKLTKRAGEMLAQMTKSLSRRYVFPWFKDLGTTESIDQEILCRVIALGACEKHFAKYNPEASDNAFAYMSQIIRCSFAQSVTNYNKTKAKN